VNYKRRFKLNLKPHFSLFIGYSGEDTPRCVIPSVCGELEEEQKAAPAMPIGEEGEDVEMNGDAGSDKRMRYFCGSDSLGLKRDHMEIKPLF